jgi:predicted MPP superfamily phosphohydrolase
MPVQIFTIGLFHALPAWSLIHWLPVPPGPWRWAVAAFFTLQTILLIFGRDVAFLKDGIIPRRIYRLSMLSFVLILNLFLASVLHLAARAVIAAGGWDVSGSLTFKIFFILAFCTVAAGLFNARRLAVRHISFSHPGFPASWQGRKILFFSDTHYGTLNGPGMAGKLVEKIESLNPDLIICGGDLFDGPGGNFGTTLAILVRLQAPLGVLAVLGNHDYFYLSRPGSSRELLQRQRNREEMPLGDETRLGGVKKALPWRFLENEAVEVDGVIFAGLRPFSLSDEKAALEFLSNLKGSGPTVLINHKPRQFVEAEKAGVILQLSGHTHGGPVFPVNIIMRNILKGRHFGTTRHGDMVMDTSIGSGISLWYPRTAGRHELVLVEIG